MIKDTLDKYKDKRISEREYLEEMYKHYDNYEKEDIVAYPETIKGNNNAKAFYGSITDVIKETDETYDTRGLSNEFAELSIMIEEAITTLTKVDWHNNKDINNDIAQAVEDLTYNFGDKHGLKLEWNAIDKIIMEIKKIAYERF